MRISDWSSDGCSSDLGRKDGVVDLDLHDVLVAGHRPVGPVGAPGAVMHRILVAQTREEGAPGVVPIDLWIADVDAVERDRGGTGSRDAGVAGHGQGHFASPRISF